MTGHASARRTVTRTTHPSCAVRAGLTLIEVLLVIGIAMLVISLMIAGLRLANERAAETRRIADLRTGVTMFSAWSNDRQGQNLHYELDPRRFSARCGVGFNGQQVCLEWFDQSVNRRWALSWLWTTGERPEVTSFSYTTTALADPRMWDPVAIPPATDRLSFMRPTFVQEVQHPSSKVMLNGSWRGERGVLLGFFDGSASRVEWDRVVQQVRGPYSSGASPYDEPGSGTPHGLRGLDVSR